MNEHTEPSSIIISHETALRGIRHARFRQGFLPWSSVGTAEQQRVLSTCNANIRNIDIDEFERLGLLENHEQIDCLVTSRSHQHVGRVVRSHLVQGILPHNSLLKMAPGVYSVSPELLLAQLASKWDLPSLVALAFELCGEFSLPGAKSQAIQPHEVFGLEPGYQEAEPATHRSKLVAVCSELTNMHGIATARKAASFALDDARSPCEAIMAGCYHLPMRYGGFGIENMRLNHRVDFSSTARSASGMRYAVLDAYAPDSSSTLEYNGLDHDATGRRIHDERRTIGLAVMGITTYPINYATLRDIEALETIAIDLYKRAGKRYRNRTTGYRVKQIVLLNGLRQAFGLKPC